MGDGTRGEKRKARQRQEAREILAPIVPHTHEINLVVQCGLGDWAEGPVLLEMFPHSQFIAVEPVARYCHEAWAKGFRGPIIQGALWSSTGGAVELQDFRTRTSMYDKEDRRGGFLAYLLTLDDAIRYLKIDLSDKKILLWADCEGSELKIFSQAASMLKHTKAIVCELKDSPKMKDWPNSETVIKEIDSLGFSFHKRVADDGLFLRKS